MKSLLVHVQCSTNTIVEVTFQILMDMVAAVYSVSNLQLAALIDAEKNTTSVREAKHIWCLPLPDARISELDFSPSDNGEESI